MQLSLLAISATILASVVSAVPADSAYINSGSEVQASQQGLADSVMQNAQALYKSDKDHGDDKHEEGEGEIDSDCFWDDEIFNKPEEIDLSEIGKDGEKDKYLLKKKQEEIWRKNKEEEALHKSLVKGAALLRAQCIKGTTTVPGATATTSITTTTTAPDVTATSVIVTTVPTTVTSTSTGRTQITTTETNTNTATEVVSETSATTTTTTAVVTSVTTILTTTTSTTYTIFGG